MQALDLQISTPSNDRLRIRELVDAAAKKQGGFKQLADLMGVHAQLVSNWRNGVKVPSPEAQADLAEIAGHNAAVVALMALIEKTTGARRARLQHAYATWSQSATPVRRS